jgi:SAM-dependent methyltransferase
MNHPAALERFFHWYWAAEHDDSRRPLNHVEFLRAERLLPEQQLTVEPAEFVLELGSGGARTARALATGGARVVALDLCARRTARLTRDSLSARLSLYACAGRAERLPLRSHSIAWVVIQTTAMHLEIASMAAEITRVLRPDGHLLLLEPRPYHPVISLYRILWSAGSPSHPAFLTCRELARVANRFHGYRVSFHGLLSPLAPRVFLPFATRCDRLLFRSIPWTRRLAWFVLMIASRPRSAVDQTLGAIDHSPTTPRIAP